MTTAFRPEDPAFFDLSARVKLRLAGADVFRFLNGQITNNAGKASENSAIQAAVLSAKGKMSAHVFLSRQNDGFVLDADPELREELPARLDRYVIADDVQIEDVTEKFSLFHVLAAGAPTVAGSIRTVAANRFGSAGWDVWLEFGEAEETRLQLGEGLTFCDEACAEILRIEQGIPRWGRELTTEIIPIEANLEESSIDYDKGCYIGQEVVSRMKMSGQTNKRLCGLVSLSGAPLHPEMRLTRASEPGKDAGWITSATKSGRLGKEIALGYVKRGYNTIGSLLQAGDVPVEVVALPFL
ncbi:MAG: tRNA-modifying protein YgfZ [Verrucomicrobiota bacterium]